MLIQSFGWNNQANWMYEAILYFAVAYILLYKLKVALLPEQKI